MSERPTPEKALPGEAKRGGAGDADKRGGAGEGEPPVGVVDAAWEQALLRGRDEDAGEAVGGSLEAELATLHLLRHVREPEAMSAAQLDATWADIDLAITPAKVPFWRAAWFKWLMPVGAAAAVAFIFVRGPGVGGDASEGSGEIARAETASAPGAQRNGDDAKAADAPAAAVAQDLEEAEVEELEEGLAAAAAKDASTSQLLEQQFSMLEPQARAELGANVDSQRGSMRAALIAQARGGAK